jgi:nitronate monooxygenase
MVALTNFGDMVKASIEEGIDVIFAGAGLPLDLPRYLNKGIKTKLVPIISSARAARLICKKWLAKFDYLPDAFVLEGPKAGGHLGFKAEQLDDPDFELQKLLKEVLAEVKVFEKEQNKQIPIIAAGGIFTGQDICRFMNLGAAGVQLGTRFVATDECDADESFKQAYVDAKKEDLVVIDSPVGLPGRALQNRFLEEVKAGTTKPFKCPYRCLKTCDSEKSPYCIALALASAKKGKFKHGFAFAGKNAYKVKKIVPVKELIASLKREYAMAAT